MAEILSAGYDFDAFKRTAKYPYDDWFNGKVWRITRGVDFDIPAKSMQINLYAAASRYDLKLRTRLEGDSALIIQAVPWSADE